MTNYDYTSLYAILGFATFLLTFGIFLVFLFFFSCPDYPSLSLYSAPYCLPTCPSVYFCRLPACQSINVSFLSDCLGVFLSDCLSVSLSVRFLSTCLYVCLYVCSYVSVCLRARVHACVPGLPVSFFLSAFLPVCLLVWPST